MLGNGGHLSWFCWAPSSRKTSISPGRPLKVWPVSPPDMKPLIRTGPSDGAMQVTLACTLHAEKIPMTISISFQLNKRASFQTCNHRVCFSPSLFSVWRRPANSVLYYLFMQTLHCKRSQKSWSCRNTETLSVYGRWHEGVYLLSPEKSEDADKGTRLFQGQ